jgi:hypothetical protein
MADNSMAAVSCLPNTTYDLASLVPTIKSSKPAGKSYVVFGKQDTAAINLSVIAAGKNTVGFVIKGESRHDYSGFSVSSAGDVNGDGLDDLIIGAHHAFCLVG